LTEEVDSTYDEAMNRIELQNQGDKELANQILSWIIFACRPLTVKELQCALAIAPGKAELDPLCIIFEESLTSVCAGLVVVDKERSAVRLVREFFVLNRDIF
jgi:hypothetical protein